MDAPWFQRWSSNLPPGQEQPPENNDDTDNSSTPFRSPTRYLPSDNPTVRTPQATSATEQRVSFVTPNNRSNNINHNTTSSVNGIGLWNAWRRSFTTPLLAFFDLFDNALDAAADEGFVDVRPDIHHDRSTTGFSLMNSAVTTIKPMKDILMAYQSNKGHTAKHIGQNGVGLKQGSATLSPCSFCLSKKALAGRVQFSIGIIAERLQQSDSIQMPSTVFVGESAGERKGHIRLWANGHAGIAECVKEYGAGVLEDGVDRLDGFFRVMVNKREHNNVFCLVLSGMYHNHGQDNEDDIDEDEEEDNVGGQVDKLLNQVMDDLPKRYLHVSPNLKVTVDGQRILFSYWQYRVAAMAKFEVNVSKDIPHASDENWKYPSEGEGYYDLRVFVGFDTARITDEAKSKNLSMHVHSRRSGRLIREFADARTVLGLGASGTEFSQGMTLVVDDYGGHLPLNPTKQDLAFTEEAMGDTHRANVNAWLKTVAKVYYSYYQKVVYSGQKTLISEAVKQAGRDIDDLANEEMLKLPPLCDCQFDSFLDGVVSGIVNGTYRARSVSSLKLQPGRDSFALLSAKELVANDARLRKLVKKKKKREQTAPETSKESRQYMTEIKALQRRVEALNDEVAELKDQNEVLEDEKDLLNSELDACQDKIKGQKALIAKLRGFGRATTSSPERKRRKLHESEDV